MENPTPDGHDMIATPAAARRRLGGELKLARETAGLALEPAAAAIQRSGPTLSRLENGRAIPRVVDVRALLDHYASVDAAAVPNGMRSRLVALAEQARKQEWFTEYNDVLTGPMTNDDSKRYVEFENDALAIRTYEPELIPGLLQTRAYAEAVTSLIYPDPEHKAADRLRFVEFRIARQRVLARGKDPLRLDAVIGEAAVRRPIGSEMVMREQVRALLDEVRNGRRNVTIRIAPITLSTRAVMQGSFVVMDLVDGDGLVYLEGPGVSQYRQTEEALQHYDVLFRELWDSVLDAADSRAMLEGVLKELG